MLRITWFDDEASGPRLLLEGRIVGDWVEVLETEIERARSGGKTFVLDLTRVDFATHPAITLLREAESGGARLLGCSPLLASLLGSEAS
jgi:hypothetical protein